MNTPAVENSEGKWITILEGIPQDIVTPFGVERTLGQALCGWPMKVRAVNYPFVHVDCHCKNGEIHEIVLNHHNTELTLLNKKYVESFLKQKEDRSILIDMDSPLGKEVNKLFPQNKDNKNV